MRRLLGFLPLLVVLAVAGAALFVLARGQKGEGFVSPRVGKPVPVLEMPNLEAQGAPVSTAGLRGRPYLLNFYASWCAPCEVEHPLLLQLRQAGVPIVGVAFKDEPAASAAFLARLGSPFEAVGVDVGGKVAFEFGVRKVPETFLVGPDGIVLSHQDGPLDAASYKRYLAAASTPPPKR